MSSDSLCFGHESTGLLCRDQDLDAWIIRPTIRILTILHFRDLNPEEAILQLSVMSKEVVDNKVMTLIPQ